MKVRLIPWIVTASLWAGALRAEEGPLAVQAPIELVVLQELDSQTIDLPSALQLAGAENPTINGARMAVQESEALLRRARAVWLPNVTAGASYRYHVGPVQSSTGQIRNGRIESAFVGSGTRPIGSDTVTIPGIRLMTQLSDAIYEPLAARQRLAARRYDANATDNNILLDAAVAYFGLLAAESRFDAMRQSYDEVQRIADTTIAYADTGQGRRGDANRAITEGFLTLVEVRRAEERMVVASAELSRVLHLEPSTRLHTSANRLIVFDLIDLQSPLQSLLQTSERWRPELASRSMEVAERQTRVRQERMRPLLPTISVGYSAGGFGGTGNFFSNNSPFASIAPRSDFDAFAVWTLQNLGAGNLKSANARQASVGAATAERLRMLNQVRAETTAAYGLAIARRRQVGMAEHRLRRAEDAFRQDYARLLGGEALPLEVLNSVRLLLSARQDLIGTITGDNEAQFRLFVAMGQPPRQAVLNVPISDSDQGESIPAPQGVPTNSSQVD